MKMNEKVFRPLYMKCIDICLVKETGAMKKNFFFKLTISLLDNLKSIFTPYMSTILEHLLKVLSDVKSFSDTFDGINLQKWKSVLTILTKSCMFDNDSKH
jgi:BP28CT (NUC211) domain